jgi:GDP-L-fucose synthase
MIHSIAPSASEIAMENAPPSARSVLVLGGHGFAGRHVAEAFAGSPHTVHVRSRRDGLDVRETEAVRRTLIELTPDVVVHCAATVGSLNWVTERAAEVFHDNLRMLLSLYRAVAELPGGRRPVIVNPVANCGYPGHLELYREEDFWNGPVHPSVLSYGNTRRMMLVAGDCYGMQHGVRSIQLLTPNMYGPYDSTDPNKAHAVNALVGKLVKAAAEEKGSFEVWGSGAAVREWLYAGDFGRLIVDVVDRLDSSAFDRPVNLAQRRGVSIRELVDLLVAELGYRGRVVWDRARPDGAPRKVMDDTRFRVVFPGFRFTDLAEGIRRTAAHYRSRLPY